jgi:PAS domain S-box-containing protein
MEPIITKVLLVENVRADAEAAVHHLREDGLHVQVSMVDDERGFRRALETFAPDLILFDDALPYFSAREALKIARTTRPDLPFILFSASISETIAAEFLEQGVNDCVPKGNPTRLAHAVRRALRETGNQQATQVAGAQLCTGDSWYRDVVELSQDAIYVWRDGRMVFANRAMARLLGAHDPADLIGKSVFEFVHPECQHLAQMRMQKLLDGGTPLPPAELKYVRLDGSTVEVEAVGAPFEFQGRPPPAIRFSATSRSVKPWKSNASSPCMRTPSFCGRRRKRNSSDCWPRRHPAKSGLLAPTGTLTM